MQKVFACVNTSFFCNSRSTAPRAIIFVPIDSEELVSHLSVIDYTPLFFIYFLSYHKTDFWFFHMDLISNDINMH